MSMKEIIEVKSNGLVNKPEQAMRWLERLTPGGSEFHDDPENCFAFIVREHHDKWNLLKRKAREVRSLSALRELYRRTIEDIYHNPSLPEIKELTEGCILSARDLEVPTPPATEAEEPDPIDLLKRAQASLGSLLEEETSDSPDARVYREISDYLEAFS